uniref:FGF n=1 Tax=Heterorhabditis bacteriophora TaxID=37862 RepID=A0A1I7XJ61_HETBA
MAELGSYISSIGGGAVSFLPFQPVHYADYYQRGNTYSYYTSRPSSSSAGTSQPFGAPDMLENCAGQARKIHERQKDNRYGAFNMADGSPYLGWSRRGALFCRSGNWLEIVDERETQAEARRGQPADPVRGTRQEKSRFSILEFISVAIGLVSIRGVQSQRYLCMDREGKLYSAPYQNYTSECVFLEEMMENYYNLYSSCAYGTRKRPWYVALRRSGRPRKGRNARKRRKASHFLVVHYDTPPPIGQFDLGRLLAPSLKHQPPRDKAYSEKLELARKVTSKTRIDKISARISMTPPTPSTIQKRFKKKKRRREQRLERENRRRRERQEELEKLRIEENRKRMERRREFYKGWTTRLPPRSPRMTLRNQQIRRSIP